MYDYLPAFVSGYHLHINDWQSSEEGVLDVWKLEFQFLVNQIDSG